MFDVEQLASSAEMQELFGVSRQRVDALTRRDDFPEPIGMLKMGRIWRLADVRRWATDHGREIAEAGQEETT